MREFKDKAGTIWQIDLCVGEVLRIKQASEGLFDLFEPETLVFPTDRERACWEADQQAMAKARLANPDVTPVPTVPCTGRPLVNVISCEQAQDWGLVYALMWRIVEPQALARELSREQFAELMPDALLVEARQQFWKEWADFFHRLQHPDKAVVLEKTAAFHATAMKLVMERLQDKTIVELDGRVEAKMRSELKTSFGNLEESLDSILDLSPTPNSGE